MQTPPTAPRGPHCPPLVPCGRWLHPFDVRAALAARSRCGAIPSMRQDEKLDHVDRDASWRLERPGGGLWARQAEAGDDVPSAWERPLAHPCATATTIAVVCIARGYMYSEVSFTTLRR